MNHELTEITAAEELFDLLGAASSPFGCVSYCRKKFEEAGFEALDYGSGWTLKKGGKYLMEHHGTCLFAFTVGEEWKPEDMIRIAGAHTDYPCMRIKPAPDFVNNRYAQVNVEVYGGAILNTWLDRPLGIAGRVMTRGREPFAPEAHLYDSGRPLMVIPNLAIHMDRSINTGVELNKQTDLMPILDCLPEERKTTAYFMDFLGKELGVDPADILDFELNTYVCEPPCLVGPQQTMISAPHLDNHTSVAALLYGMLTAERRDGINLIAMFDHEEVGSNGKQGAGSMLLSDMLVRILEDLGASSAEIHSAVYNAFILSLDVAHAVHPNHMGKADITNKPLMGSGFCIKEAAAQSYATDAEAIACLCQICDREGIPYQRFSNRSDIRGGTTIGVIISRMIPAKTVDIGIPILAMHSARELMGTADQKAMDRCVEAFFTI